jgi:hypothetical protein
MQPLLILMLLALLTMANGAPVIAKKMFGGTLSQPLDGGARLLTGGRYSARRRRSAACSYRSRRPPSARR